MESRRTLYWSRPENFSTQVEGSTCICFVGDKFLLLQNNDKKGYGCAGKWCTPGGTLESGEDAINFLLREVQEETAMILPEQEIAFLEKIYIHDPEI